MSKTLYELRLERDAAAASGDHATALTLNDTIARIKSAAKVVPSEHHALDMKVSPALVLDKCIVQIKQQGYGDENGNGTFAFNEDNIEWERAEDSSDMYAIVYVARDDLLWLRDHLIDLFPPADFPKGQS